MNTNIVATLGPASIDRITQLYDAGVRVFRLNLSHGTHDWHAQRLADLNALRAQFDEQIMVFLDTKGPEVRTGVLADPIALAPGDSVMLSPDPTTGQIGLSHAGLASDVQVGDTVLIDSGMQSWTITHIADATITCQVVRGGMLTSRRHLNVPGRTMSLPAITDLDWADMQFALTQDVDAIAMSFVRTPEDVQTLRQFFTDKGQHMRIIAKIETAEAVEHAVAITQVSDGIMVARGDLGAEVPLAQVPRIERELVQLARDESKPVIVATQMLESMMHSPVPTRAEVTDVYMAVEAGADAVMLSGETAAGEYPIRTVEVMAQVICEAELHTDHAVLRMPACQKKAVCELCQMASHMSYEMPSMQGIVVLTRTGFMAQQVSRFRPEVPIIALSPDDAVCHFLALSFGVQSLCAPWTTQANPIQFAVQQLIEQGMPSGDYVFVHDSLEGDAHVPTLQVRTL